MYTFIEILLHLHWYGHTKWADLGYIFKEGDSYRAYRKFDGVWYLVGSADTPVSAIVDLLNGARIGAETPTVFTPEEEFLLKMIQKDPQAMDALRDLLT